MYEQSFLLNLIVIMKLSSYNQLFKQFKEFLDKSLTFVPNIYTNLICIYIFALGWSSTKLEKTLSINPSHTMQC